jgi:membrane-associated protease RseP (regulator of RpoE activity)
MKRIASLSGLLALVFVGCGLISSPPIDNPFGLQGRQSTIDLGPSSEATGTATATVTFNDITLNSPLTPTGFTYNLAISNVQFSGSGCPSSLPGSVQVKMDVSITVSDNPNPTSRPRTASARATNVQFNLNASGSGYTVSNLTGGSLTFSNLQTLLNILQDGGQNTATLNATVNTTSNPDLAGCTMIITWGGGKGVLKF